VIVHAQRSVSCASEIYLFCLADFICRSGWVISLRKIGPSQASRACLGR
jgi:hypothetical protein